MQASKIKLCSCAAVATTLEMMGMGGLAQVVRGLAQVSKPGPVEPSSGQVGASVVRQLARGVARPASLAPARIAAHVYPFTVPFPGSLAKLELTHEEKLCNYGLLEFMVGKNDPDKLPPSVPLRAEWQSYLSWFTDPLNIRRSSKVVSLTTMTDHLKVISKYMGYLLKYKQVRGWVINGAQYDAFISRVVAACVNVHITLSLVTTVHPLLLPF